MKPILIENELMAELEKRSGVHGLHLIRRKGYVPSWELGGLRPKDIDQAAEKKLQDTVAKMQDEFDMA
ncbi:hypothetical protein ACE102_33795 [Bradyrhizobium sp. vgs-9]|uniref:hypothetical protein n=1 Tax=Bradyrhizobium sp. vgs-9 TaxID=208389 RepID=UPI0035D4617A